MAVRRTSENVFGTPLGTFWDHSGRFLGVRGLHVGGGGGVLRAPSLKVNVKDRITTQRFYPFSDKLVIVLTADISLIHHDMGTSLSARW